MNQSVTVRDWSAGEEGIAYQRCHVCNSVWYFKRAFCPRCGDAHPLSHQSEGFGALYSVTLVTRAPSEELRALAPYLIALVDMDEGFRMMAQCERDLRIAERVRARFIPFGGRMVPFFDRVG